MCWSILTVRLTPRSPREDGPNEELSVSGYPVGLSVGGCQLLNDAGRQTLWVTLVHGLGHGRCKSEGRKELGSMPVLSVAGSTILYISIHYNIIHGCIPAQSTWSSLCLETWVWLDTFGLSMCNLVKPSFREDLYPCIMSLVGSCHWQLLHNKVWSGSTFSGVGTGYPHLQ